MRLLAKKGLRLAFKQGRLTDATREGQQSLLGTQQTDDESSA